MWGLHICFLIDCLVCHEGPNPWQLCSRAGESSIFGFSSFAFRCVLELQLAPKWFRKWNRIALTSLSRNIRFLNRLVDRFWVANRSQNSALAPPFSSLGRTLAKNEPQERSGARLWWIFTAFGAIVDDCERFRKSFSTMLNARTVFYFVFGLDKRKVTVEPKRSN